MTISSTSSPPKRRHPSTARRRTASLLNVGMTMLSAGGGTVGSATAIGLQVERERCMDAAGKEPRRQKREAPDEPGRRAAGKLRNAGEHDDVLEAFELERAAQRHRREVIHMHEIVGQRRTIAGPQ